MYTGWVNWYKLWKQLQKCFCLCHSLPTDCTKFVIYQQLVSSKIKFNLSSSQEPSSCLKTQFYKTKFKIDLVGLNQNQLYPVVRHPMTFHDFDDFSWLHMIQCLLILYEILTTYGQIFSRVSNFIIDKSDSIMLNAFQKVKIWTMFN